MIFVSTGGFKESADEIVPKFADLGIRNIELSGGSFHDTLIENLNDLKRKYVFQVHNYFPPHKIPFVFNLATLNPQIAEQSINHVKTAIDLASSFGRPIYSFHAGYLIDPAPEELGKKIKTKLLIDRKEGMKIFLDRVNFLSDYARNAGVELLVENNVLSKQNLEGFSNDPLLMTTPEEAIVIMENTSSNVNLLLDVAHLKVSSRSLGFEPSGFFEKCNQWIKAYHFSDNDGTEDSNQPVREDSWFWKFINKELNYYSLEIYNSDFNLLHNQYQLTEKMLQK